MEGSRIEREPVSYYSIVCGFIAVVAVAVGIFLYSHVQAAKVKTKTYDPNTPLPKEPEIRRMFSDEQYRVVRQGGTETAFRNAYWDEKRPGIYVDAISGEPLFLSSDKYDAGTGRPTFTKPIDKNRLTSREDNSYDMKRIEIRAKKSDIHLGHWFSDPSTPTGERYAVNSCSLRFIPADKLSQEGYNEFVPMFKDGIESQKQAATSPSR